MLSVTKRALATAGATVFAVGALLVPAAAAQAAPQNCFGKWRGNTYEAYCGQGTGNFRAFIRCYRITTGAEILRYGAWERAGGGVSSFARCLTGEEPGGGIAQF